MTASESASKIAERRSRSERSASNVWRSAARIVSSDCPSSVISSRPPVPSSGRSSWPWLILAAQSASFLIREVIALAIRNEIATATSTRDDEGGDPVAAHRVDRVLQLRRARGPHQERAVERPVAEDRLSRPR